MDQTRWTTKLAIEIAGFNPLDFFFGDI